MRETADSPPTPIFQIQVHGDAALGCHLHIATDIGGVCFECLAQLSLAMAAGAFAQKIYGTCACALYPVEALAVIDKAQHLHAVQHPF